MTNLKINDLAAAGSVSGAMQIETDIAGTTPNKITATQLRNFANANVNLGMLGVVLNGVSAGIAGDLVVPYSCTINSVELLADQSGSIVVDIWKASYSAYPPLIGGSICASAIPTLSSAIKNQDSTLTGWTTALNAGDILRFNVNSASNVTRVTLLLAVTKS